MKKVLLVLSLIFSMILLIPNSEASAKPLRAPDGRLVLEVINNVAIDGDKIYYSLDGQQYGCYSVKKKSI